MKREQLLQAIGGVGDSLLLESEQIPSRKRFPAGKLVLVAALVALLTLTAAAATGVFAGLFEDTGGSAQMSNLATGMRTVVWSDGYLYHGVTGYIYKCDTQGNVLNKFPLGDRYETPAYLFATEDAIVYVTITGVPVAEGEGADREHHWGLRRISKNGSAPESLFPDIICSNVYVEGTQLYTTNRGQMLTRIDLATLESTELLDNTHEYFVDDTYIYAVQSGNEQCYFRSRKDTIHFEKIALDFDPNKIVADGENLYLCHWLDEETRRQEDIDHRYQVCLVRNGITTPLPVYSWFYQILNDCVLYRDDADRLMQYHTKTGQTRMLAENVYEFSVLDEQHVFVETFNADPILLDLETGNRHTVSLGQ